MGGWGVCGCVCVCGSGMLICFVSALGSHEMGRHKLPIIIIIIFEACDCLKLLSIEFDLCVDVTGAVCHQFGLLGTDLHAVGCGGLSRRSTKFASSFSSPAKPSMSSAKRRLVIVLPPMLTVPS